MAGNSRKVEKAALELGRHSSGLPGKLGTCLDESSNLLDGELLCCCKKIPLVFNDYFSISARHLPCRWFQRQLVSGRVQRSVDLSIQISLFLLQIEAILLNADNCISLLYFFLLWGILDECDMYVSYLAILYTSFE